VCGASWHETNSVGDYETTRLHQMTPLPSNYFRDLFESHPLRTSIRLDSGSASDSLLLKVPLPSSREKRKTLEETQPSASKKQRREGMHTITRLLLFFECASGLTRTSSRKCAASRSSNANHTRTPQMGTPRVLAFVSMGALHLFTTGTVKSTMETRPRSESSTDRDERTLLQESDLAGIISVERTS
jgi:hypothetical protein